MNNTVRCALDGFDAEFNVPLSRLTTIRIGGEAAAVLSPKNEDEVMRFIAVCKKEGIPYFVLGGGSNVLADDRGYVGVILRFERRMAQIETHGETLVAQSGARLSSIFDCCKYYNLGGAEFMSGIPATVGGAIYNNAGCFGYQMSDVVVRVFAVNGRTKRVFEKDELNFGYRQSVFQQNREWVITGAELKFRQGFDHSVAEETAQKKRLSQPLKSLSLGSVFKKKGEVSPAFIIDKLGLKGLSVGGAQVSRVHAGFIVNATRRATSDDVKSLIDIITEEVKRYTNITLEREVEYLEYRDSLIV